MIDMSKTYRTRDGKDVRIYATDGGGILPVHGAIKRDGIWMEDCWSCSGDYHPTKENTGRDLVEFTMLADQETEQMTNKDTPTLWADMTPEQKGALLLAKHEGRDVQMFENYKWAWATLTPQWYGWVAYRVEPEPTRETVTAVGHNKSGNVWSFAEYDNMHDTHRITFETINGEPDCATIRMERLT